MRCWWRWGGEALVANSHDNPIWSWGLVHLSESSIGLLQSIVFRGFQNEVRNVTRKYIMETWKTPLGQGKQPGGLAEDGSENGVDIKGEIAES